MTALLYRFFWAFSVVFIPLTPLLAQNAEPTPVQIALARDVVRGSGMGRSFSSMIPQISAQMTQTLTATRPEIAADLKSVLDNLRSEFDKQSDDMLDIAAKIVAKRLSEKELTDTAAFFKSDSGKKYVESQPASLDELVVALQGWSQKISASMFERVRVEMKKRGHDL